MQHTRKVEMLRDLFGAGDVEVSQTAVRVGEKSYPIIDDVVILSPTEQQTPYIRERLSKTSAAGATPATDFAPDIQSTFGDEWQAFSQILPEHQKEFESYFDLVDLNSLRDQRVCDLGCGSGRWSSFLKDRCREIVLVDFSDAIFVARRNLGAVENALFFHCDLKRLPFRDDFADFLFCLGVLHHLPTPCLDEVRRLRPKARALLIYLYYALDNRPAHYRWMLKGVTAARHVLSRVRNPTARSLASRAGAIFLYMPLIALGRALRPVGLASHVPLYDAYRSSTPARIEQDVYDRFFTRIEQRVSRQEIRRLADTFSEVTVSENIPYWHFLCAR